MREVEASRIVGVTPIEVRRHLSPATLIDYEGTFGVVDVSEGDGTTVTARGGGMEVVFEFVPREDGYEYAQRGAEGPFESMSTRVTIERADGGDRGSTRVTMRSSVSLGLPLRSVTDRLAGWKRRGELERAFDRLAADLEE